MYLNSNDPVQFEIVRTFQARFPGNVYGPSQPVSSPTVSASYTHNGQLANNVTLLTVYPHPENPYGKETLSVYTLDSHGNIIQPTLNAVPIMVYPVSTAKIYNSLSYFPTSAPASSPSSGFATSPPSTTSSSPYPSPSPFGIPYPSPAPGATPNPLVNFTGDTARLDVEIDNAYPGGTTWVVVYPGTASATPPSSAREVANSRLTAPTTDLVAERDVFVEVGTGQTPREVCCSQPPPLQRPIRSRWSSSGRRTGRTGWRLWRQPIYGSFQFLQRQQPGRQANAIAARSQELRSTG